MVRGAKLRSFMSSIILWRSGVITCSCAEVRGWGNPHHGSAGAWDRHRGYGGPRGSRGSRSGRAWQKGQPLTSEKAGATGLYREAVYRALKEARMRGISSSESDMEAAHKRIRKCSFLLRFPSPVKAATNNPENQALPCASQGKESHERKQSKETMSSDEFLY